MRSAAVEKKKKEAAAGAVCKSNGPTFYFHTCIIVFQNRMIQC